MLDSSKALKMKVNQFWRDTMALKLNIPTLDSPEAAKNIKETILTAEPDAKVDVDIDSKTVTVEAKASEETFKQLIEATGHRIESR
jgi:copper chaperone